MNYIDSKYINILSGQLQQFKKKNDNLYNFRCPFCGDSEKNKLKARGYVFVKETNYIYKCHNCGIGKNLDKLIEHVDLELYKNYRVERYLTANPRGTTEKTGKTDIVFKKRKYKTGTPLKRLKTISQLSHEHKAKRYILQRQIPNKAHRKLFYAPRFAQFVNTIIPGKLDERFDEDRLILPFLDEYENLIGFQGRSFKSNSFLRYITIMLDENKPKIFGLDEIDSTKKVYVTEGPIDSLFLDNCLSMAGADMDTYIDDMNLQDVVVIYDNEPRNLEIIKKISKSIEANRSVVVWPSFLKNKDINDMILAGITQTEICEIINDNTFSKLQAKAKLSEWRKV